MICNRLYKTNKKKKYVNARKCVEVRVLLTKEFSLSFLCAFPCEVFRAQELDCVFVLLES